jgi:hypothetical protein
LEGVNDMACHWAKRVWRASLATIVIATLSLALAGPSYAGTRSHASSAATAKAKLTAKAKIIADWEAFFSGKTPAKRKIALVQDGKDFARVIESQASSPMAKSTTAKVLAVTVSGDRATVRYTVYLGGQPALKDQTGEAILQDGVWKVGAGSFCSLLALEGTKVPICAQLAKKK